MFDSRYFAFAAISALLVVSPGATMAVVLETVVGEGRRAALWTVAGINIGNSTLALTSALGMAVVFHAWPSALEVVKVGGAAYLTFLGLRGLWFAARGRDVPTGAAASHAVGADQPDPASTWPFVSRGIATNLLNPPVVLFYMTFLPQFIGPADPFFLRFLVLAATHVGMSLVWLSCYVLALGFLTEHFARPAVRRSLEGLTGIILVGLGVRLLLR